MALVCARGPTVAARARTMPFGKQAVRAPMHIVRAKTQSVSETDLPLGTKAPYFELTDTVSGKTVKLTDFEGASALLVTFICVHCPYVVHLKGDLSALAKEYQAKGVKVVAISSNSTVTHPQDGPEKMAEDAKKYDYIFPFLFDATQEVAQAYKAACTPEFYVFDREQKLTYHGQYDQTRPKQDPPQIPTGKDLRAALDATLSGQPVPSPQRPSIGCNIKWAPGREPSYYGAQLVAKV